MRRFRPSWISPVYWGKGILSPIWIPIWIKIPGKTGDFVCTTMVCLTVRTLIPSFPEGPASAWGNHNNLRRLRPGETPQTGDVARFGHHVGLWDPRHNPSLLSNTTSILIGV